MSASRGRGQSANIIITKIFDMFKVELYVKEKQGKRMSSFEVQIDTRKAFQEEDSVKGRMELRKKNQIGIYGIKLQKKDQLVQNFNGKVRRMLRSECGWSWVEWGERRLRVVAANKRKKREHWYDLHRQLGMKCQVSSREINANKILCGRPADNPSFF